MERRKVEGRGGEGYRRWKLTMTSIKPAPNSIHQRTLRGMDKFRIARLGVVTLGEWEETTARRAL
jgi:hypothetical protein